RPSRSFTGSVRSKRRPIARRRSTNEPAGQGQLVLDKLCSRLSKLFELFGILVRLDRVIQQRLAQVIRAISVELEPLRSVEERLNRRRQLTSQLELRRALRLQRLNARLQRSSHLTGNVLRGVRRWFGTEVPRLA